MATEQEAEHDARIAGQEIWRERARVRKTPTFGHCEAGSEGGITRSEKRPRTLDLPHCLCPGEQEDRGEAGQSDPSIRTLAGELLEDQTDRGSHPRLRRTKDRDLHRDGGETTQSGRSMRGDLLGVRGLRTERDHSVIHRLLHPAEVPSTCRAHLPGMH